MDRKSGVSAIQILILVAHGCLAVTHLETTSGGNSSSISVPITIQYKSVNNVPLMIDIYPVGDQLVTNVSSSCLAELVHYCPKSYNRDPTCSTCIADHHIHIIAAGCPDDVFLIQNFYCGTKPQAGDGGFATAAPRDELHPLLIYIHGGGWGKESKNAIPDYVRQVAESQRYVLASIQYRLTTEAVVFGGIPAVIWPAQRDDCLDAVQKLQDIAPMYGADRERTACIGTSAGGHLCSMTAAYGRRYATTSLKLAVPLYGPTNILNMTLDIDPAVGCRMDHDAVGSFESRLLGSDMTNISIGQIRANLNNQSKPWPGLVALAHSANPVNFVGEGSPPMFLAHGTKDTLVPYKQSQRLVNALTTMSVRNTFVPADGCNHASEPRDCWQDAVTVMQKWLAENL